jgi:Na+/melibiose symporter-like transporter
MVDACKTVSLHMAVLVGLYRGGDVADGWLLLPVVFVVAAVVFFFAMLLNEALRERAGAVTRAQASTERPSTLRSLVLLPTDYGTLCLTFTLLGSTPYFLGAYGVMAACTVGFLVLALPRWRAEIGGLAGRPVAA